MRQALYRKHRSRSLDEVIGQEHITETLHNAIKQGRISHAYLLTGPRGVGKTSIARILAHGINGLPYTDDSSHIDIIEIDAASNRRIDEIRDLRERVSVAPTSAKYKVYIIDEVHMLTKEAFNALLKTLEEPPAHVVFILATTDAHKLPDTIVSRTQRFSFRPVQKAKVIDHLKSIANQEDIKISDAALELLADHGEGSFRDSISLLDQAASSGKSIELVDVQQLLGIPPTELIDKIIASLSNNSSISNIINELESLYVQGYQPAIISKQLAVKLRNLLISGNLAMDTTAAIQLLDRLLNVPSSHDSARYLELVLIKNAPQTTKVIQAAEIDSNYDDSEPANESIPAEPASLLKNIDRLDKGLWPNILSELKQKHNTLYGVVRMAQPNFGTMGLLELTFSFAFHQKRCDETSNRQKLASIIFEITGQNVEIVCLLDLDAKPPKIRIESKKPTNKNDLKAISNIFGEAELLES